MSEAIKIDHSARKHALLSASGASRWMNCTPSPLLEEGIKNTSSKYAREGTLAHEFAELNLMLELKLLTKEAYDKTVEPLKKNEFYSKDMEEHVQKHVDYVIEQFTEAKRRTPDAELFIEKKVDFSSYVENGFGTCDDIIIADGVLEVIDYKHGQGVRVSAEENPQLKLYGLGALIDAELMYNIETVRLTIVQPRLDSISTWDISAYDLKKWAEEEVKPKAEMAVKGEGELCSGDWCKFCKVKPKCPKLAQEAMSLAKDDFSDVKEEIKTLSDQELIEAYKMFPKILSWIKSVGDHITSEAIKGKSWPEHKLVAGRSNRAWKDKEAVEKELKKKRIKKDDYLSKPALLGITAIEKVLGKPKFNALLSNFVEKPLGKPTLVHESDKRPEYKESSIEDDFCVQNDFGEEDQDDLI